MPPLRYRLVLVTAAWRGGGGFGLTVGRLGDDLDLVCECHTENDFWQLVTVASVAHDMSGWANDLSERLALLRRVFVRRPEAVSGVRVLKFLDILGR
jgi:hypothetical protein